jgi:hypothetical protein
VHEHSGQRHRVVGREQFVVKQSAVDFADTE